MRKKKPLNVFSTIEKICKNQYVFGRHVCNACPFAVLKNKVAYCLFRPHPEYWDTELITTRYNDYTSKIKMKKKAIQTAMLKKLAGQED